MEVSQKDVEKMETENENKDVTEAVDSRNQQCEPRRGKKTGIIKEATDCSRMERRGGWSTAYKRIQKNILIEFLNTKYPDRKAAGRPQSTGNGAAPDPLRQETWAPQTAVTLGRWCGD